MGKARDVYKKQVLEIGRLYFNKRQTLAEIAEQKNLNIQTVWENVQQYRKWTNEAVEPETIVADHLAESLSIKDQLIRECQKHLENEQLHPRTKAEFIKIIEDLIKDKLDLFERLKLIEKPSQKMDIQITKYEQDRQWVINYYQQKKNSSSDSSPSAKASDSIPPSTNKNS